MKRIAQKKVKVEFQGRRCYVGVDVHKASYYVALLSEEGLRREFSHPADPQALLNTLSSLGVEIAGLAQESGPTGYELAWACQNAGIAVTVAAASKIPRPVTAGGKTDRLDSMKLAEYLAKGMLKGIAVPTRQEHALRALERRRQQLVYNRMKLKQQIKSFLLSNGLSEPAGLRSWSLEGIKELAGLSLQSPFLRLTLASYLSQLKFLLDELSLIRQALSAEMARCGHGERLNNLRSVPGVGQIVSQTFVAEIFRPERFERPEEICAYVGLAPVTSQSGQGKAQARLRAVGQRYLRSILVESSWILIGKETSFREVYKRVLSRTGLPQKAIVAVARRLLIVMWRLAVENRSYRPTQV